MYHPVKQMAKFSSLAAQVKFSDVLKMNAWQLHSYEEDLQLSSTRTPFLRSVDNILVKVDAVSVNPIDLYMKGIQTNFIAIFYYI